MRAGTVSATQQCMMDARLALACDGRDTDSPVALQRCFRHIDDDALEGKAVACKDTPAPLVKLARISLQGGAKCRCCDVTRDCHLVAVGSNAGLHLFGFHLKEVIQMKDKSEQKERLAFCKCRNILGSRNISGYLVSIF